MGHKRLGGFMKKKMALFLTLSFLVFAGEKYGVYDLQGNRVSTFEAEPRELLEKTNQIKSAQPNKNLYISSLEKGKSSKPISRYRYKTEKGAYIEVSKKETFSICPSKEIKGTWISKHSVALNAENCLSVQAPNLTGTIRVLFLHNSGKTDTIQVLVNQSYIQMGDYSHRIWVVDTNSTEYSYRVSLPFPGNMIKKYDPDVVQPGNYENRTYNKNLIVDKTKLTIPEADYYFNTYKYYENGSNIDSATYEKITSSNRKYIYPKNENFKESELPYIEGFRLGFANDRSKEEGLDTAYIYIQTNSGKDGLAAYENIARKNKNLILLSDVGRMSIDTSTSGYRLPYEDEWFYLMRAGASTTYYWGNEDDSLTVSRYAWISPMGVKPVAKLKPNKFGLYDMIGMTTEEITILRNYEGRWGLQCINYYGLQPECSLIRKAQSFEEYTETSLPGEECKLKKGETEWKCIKIDTTPKLKKRKTEYSTIRLVRETPKLHKLEKF